MARSTPTLFKSKILIGFFGAVLVLLGASLSFNSFYNPNQTNYAKAATLSNADLANLVINCDSVNNLTTTTSCKFDLPPNLTLPSGFGLGLEGTLSYSSNCTTVSNLVTCGVPVDGIAAGYGIRRVYVKVGTDPIILTSSNVYIQPSGNRFTSADFSYSPNRGALAPLFRSNDLVTVTVKNFKTNLDLSPQASTYKCTFQARALQPKSGTGAWQNLASNVDYDPANGCSAQLTKSIRGSGLNWSIKANITKTADSTQSYDLYDSFVYRFQGAGSAAGN